MTYAGQGWRSGDALRGGITRADADARYIYTNSTTTFHADGTIEVTGDVPSTTTFNADGTITTVYGDPVGKTVTTIFNADGTITTEVS